MKTCGVLFIFFLCISCTSRFKPKQPVNIGINFRLLDSDTIKLYYILKGQDTYTEENSVSFHIKGSTDFQNIKLMLEQTPQKFRIDLGENRIENEIYFSSIIVSNNMDSILITDKTLHRFFTPNIYALQLENGRYGRIKIENRYDPFLESTALLHKKVELELL